VSEASFLYKYRHFLLALYVFGGAFFLLAIESVLNGVFYFSMRLLWLPVAILVFGFTWLNRDFLYRKMKSRWETWAVALFAYPFLLFITWPYVMALNALSSTGETITYRGPIQRKWVAHGRATSYQIDVLDAATSQVVTLIIRPQEYAALKEGDRFSTKFIRGGFGIPYRWRFGRKGQIVVELGAAPLRGKKIAQRFSAGSSIKITS
jgi:hypothetical protein